ncbi:hypothetical protein JXL21_05625 [Candidatus Bathyarchaeota archaeon]|nr:hypothetical protein [Candidatus Bathyarchaeota archaeon]
MKTRSALLMTTLALLLAPAVHAQDYTPKTLDVLIYGDGVAQIGYAAETDPSLVRVDIGLPGFPYESLLVVDQDGLPLDASVYEDGVTVDTLGSTGVELTYLTSSLTSKTGSIWTLNVSSAISVGITLPEGATIINLSDVPIEIGTVEDKPFLRMLPGEISVSYLTSVFDVRGKSEDAIAEAQQHIQWLLDEGLILTEAVSLFQQAVEAFDQSDYSGALQLAGESIDTADEAQAEAVQAAEMIAAATLAVSEAVSDGRTGGVSDAQQLLAQATSAYGDGEYSAAYGYASQSQAAAMNAEKPQSYTLYIGAGIAALVLGAGLFLRVNRREGSTGEKELLEVDLDALFEDNPELRMDDREIIKFIAESGGELFANEIRERFDIPRTSAWRRIRRLESLEIIEERKVGGQSLISIHMRYRK